MKHLHQISLAQPEVRSCEHKVEYLLQVCRNRPVLHEYYGFKLWVLSLLTLKYADELTDFAGHLVPVLYPITSSFISPSLLFASPLLVLHLRVHVEATADDLLNDHLIDEAIEDLDDAGALGAEFLRLLLKKVSA